LVEETQADEGTAEMEESLVDVGAALVADGQPTELVKPGEGALDHPPMAPQLLAGLDPLAGDPAADAIRQRDALAFDRPMPLGARLAAIDWIRASLGAPHLAGTVAASTAARSPSIPLRAPRSARMTWCNACPTPAWCQSRSRRQQVTPLPQPISWGNISQGRPLRRTNRLPVSAARSGTRGRPPFGVGFSGGKSGSIAAHSVSETNGRAMPQAAQDSRHLPRFGKALLATQFLSWAAP
jgi:hypothetical protein